MAAGAHRNTDSRACGATTVTAQAKNVYVNGLLWSINGDPNSHGGGNLIAATKNVFIGGGSFINPNISICDDVVIGSGSVVINDIIEAGVYVGAPAHKIT